MEILLNKDRRVLGNYSLICRNVIIGEFEGDYIVIETTRIHGCGDTATHVTSQAYSFYDEAIKEACDFIGVEEEEYEE